MPPLLWAGILRRRVHALVEDLRQFANPLGLAFQVADDVLDVTADGEAMGKPVGRDKEQGKASFVDFYGLKGRKNMPKICAKKL